VRPRRKQRSGWRLWVDRLVFALGILIWLVGSLIVSFSSGLAGIACFCVGAIYGGGEIWIERRGEQHPTVAVLWWIVWRTLFGGGLIALGTIYLRWDSVVLFIFGVWSLALAGGVPALLWRAQRRKSSDGKPA